MLPAYISATVYVKDTQVLHTWGNAHQVAVNFGHKPGYAKDTAWCYKLRFPEIHLASLQALPDCQVHDTQSTDILETLGVLVARHLCMQSTPFSVENLDVVLAHECKALSIPTEQVSEARVQLIATGRISIHGQSVEFNRDTYRDLYANFARIRLSHQLYLAMEARKAEIDTLVSEARAIDPFYRLYHGSFKTYGIQGTTRQLLDFFKSLLPTQELNAEFVARINAGTTIKFQLAHNQAWRESTNPMWEAYFHAYHFLLCMQSSLTHQYESNLLSSDWAAVLYLYNLR